MSIILDQMPDFRSQVRRDQDRIAASMRARLTPVLQRARRLWPIRTGYSSARTFLELPGPTDDGVEAVIGNFAEYAIFIGSGGRYGGRPYVDPVTGQTRKPRASKDTPGQALLIGPTKRAAESILKDCIDLFAGGLR